jgi:hypothetical protein
MRERDVLAHDVVELPYITRPFSRRQQLDRLRRIDLALAAFLGDLFQEVRDQQGDVLAAASERRHLDVHHVQPVV